MYTSNLTFLSKRDMFKTVLNVICYLFIIVYCYMSTIDFTFPSKRDNRSTTGLNVIRENGVSTSNLTVLSKRNSMTKTGLNVVGEIGMSTTGLNFLSKRDMSTTGINVI